MGKLEMAFLEPLIKLDGVKSYLSRIEEALEKELARYKNSFFYEPLLYAVKGGKRIRPLILVLSAECVGDGKKNPYPAAVAIELSHTESLIHDDIVDKETFRRGKLAFHAKYGQPAAILSADFTLAMVLDILIRYRKPSILKEIVLSVLKMCEGEILDVKAQYNPQSLNWNTYINIVEKKTASLFYAAARIGAIIGGGKKWEINSLSNYGLLFGVSYQIRDDLSDLKKEGETSDALKTLLQNFEVDEVTEHLTKMVKEYSTKAIGYLEPLKNTKAKEYLCELAKLIAEQSL